MDGGAAGGGSGAWVHPVSLPAFATGVVSGCEVSLGFCTAVDGCAANTAGSTDIATPRVIAGILVISISFPATVPQTALIVHLENGQPNIPAVRL